MDQITPQQLLAEFDDLLRIMPPRATIRHDTQDNLAWLGRAAALVNLWNRFQSPFFQNHLDKLSGNMAAEGDIGFRNISMMLHQARHELQLKTIGPLTVAINQGGVFDYFDEVRKVIETAREDLFFVDPYLDTEFVLRYLTHISPGTKIRLLTSKKLATLLPAVELLKQQQGLSIEVRSTEGLHDRYLFIDRRACYQSGSSFKDGAKKAPTTLTQISDAFDAMWNTYDQAWQKAKIEA